MAERIDIKETRSQLKEFHDGLDTLFKQLKDDHDKGPVCTTFPDFVRAAPAGYLDRAGERLDKRSYKIGVAGVFSAGKSTLVNALLGEPDVLPTQAGECTMSITVVSAPAPGDGEHVKVHYFSKEDALKYVFNNPRYKLLLADLKGDVWAPQFSADKAVMAVKQGAEKAGQDPRQAEKKGELTEFVAAVEEYEARLGTVWVDDLKNCAQYLTTDGQNKGMGHLLLIEEVHLHQSNDLFTKDGFEIIDLPGTDSTNDRQKELTLGYLNEADAILNVIEPRGIAAAGKEIFEEMDKHNNDVKNKMFFIMNMFDKMPLSELGKEDIERVIRSQVLSKLIDFGLDTEKFFLTSAKYQDLQNRKDRGTITNVELKELENVMTDCNSKLNALDKNIEPKIYDLMETCFKDGGVVNFKKHLMQYLRYDIQVERLWEVYTDLNRVYDAAKSMLDSEEPRVRELQANLKGQSAQLQEFFDLTKDAFFDKVNLINRGVEIVVQKGMESVRGKLTTGIASIIDRYNIDRVRNRMMIQTPRDIKLEVINHFKPTLSARFADMVRETLPGLISGKLNQLIEESRVGEVIEKITEDMSHDWNEEFKQLVHLFENNINQFTYMRTLEETWHLQDTPIQVPAGEPQWTEQVEASFKEDLKTLFVKAFVDFAQKLTNVIGRHYKLLVVRLIEDFEKLIDAVAVEIRKDPESVTLPLELLKGEGDDDEQQRVNRSLLSYFRAMEPIARTHARLKDILGARN